jgi:hypothetical protein
MLNEASINIDEEPNGDYENGHIGIDDAEDVEKAEGVDDELEEMDAGTYEDAASKKDHIARRTANYTEVEDEALIRAWDSVTLDGVTGTDQTGKRYWQQIEDMFCYFMPRLAHRPPRTYRSLQGRWDAIKSPYSRWTACMDQVQAAPPSGTTIREYVSLLRIIICCICCG